MGIVLSNDVRQFVEGPNFAHLAAIMPDGSPHSAPVWIGREHDLLLVCTEAPGKSLRRLRLWTSGHPWPG
jgi:Pyridoxamine 5'-phosphate oxidase